MVFGVIREVMLPSAATLQVQLHFFLPAGAGVGLPPGALVGASVAPPSAPLQEVHVTSTGVLTAAGDPDPVASHAQAAVGGISAGWA